MIQVVARRQDSSITKLTHEMFLHLTHPGHPAAHPAHNNVPQFRAMPNSLKFMAVCDGYLLVGISIGGAERHMYTFSCSPNVPVIPLAT